MIKQEAKGCYLVTEISEETAEREAFSLRMLSENRIRGLLPLQLRTFNGEKSIYYEITKLQSLESFCRIKTFSGERVLALLTALYRLCQILPDYCLKEEMIELTPDRIYTDGSGFFFCYALSETKSNPEADSKAASQATTDHRDLQPETGQKKRAAFAGELLGLIDHEDEEAVVYGYRFYKMISEASSLLVCLEKTLGDGREGAPEDPEGLSDDAAHAFTHSRKVAGAGKGIGTGDGAGESPLSENRSDWDEEEKAQKKMAKGRDALGAILFFLLSLVGIGLLYLRSLQFQPFRLSLLLSSKEGICGAAFFLIGIPGAILSIRKDSVEESEKPTLQK